MKKANLAIENFNKVIDYLYHLKNIDEVYEKTQNWGRIDFVKKIVQMQQDIDDLTSCINVYRKDIDKAIKILGGKK